MLRATLSLIAHEAECTNDNVSLSPFSPIQCPANYWACESTCVGRANLGHKTQKGGPEPAFISWGEPLLAEGPRRDLC